MSLEALWQLPEELKDFKAAVNIGSYFALLTLHSLVSQISLGPMAHMLRYHENTTGSNLNVRSRSRFLHK